MVWLVDPGSVIGSGALINLNALEVTYSHNNLFPIPQTPGKSTGSGWNFRLAKARYLGFENPSWKITGFFENPIKHWTPKAGTGTYFITGSMLKGLATTGSVVALIDPKTIYAEPQGGGSLAYVAVKGYALSRTPDSSLGAGSHGYIINYSIDLQEVQV